MALVKAATASGYILRLIYHCQPEQSRWLVRLHRSREDFYFSFKVAFEAFKSLLQPGNLLEGGVVLLAQRLRFF